jgi:hypothetical protein
MSDTFTRWRSQGASAPDGAADVLAAGAKTPEMPDEARRQMDAYITSLAATPALPWWSGSIAPKLVAVALTVSVGALWLNRSARVVPAPRPTMSAPVLAAPTIAPPAHEPPSPRLVVAPPASPPLSPPPPPVASSAPAPRRAAPEIVAVTPDQLAEEVAQLDRARRALESDPRQALRALDSHARSWPQGALAAEREFLAVDALIRANDRAAAQRRGAQFLRRYGDSPYVRRVRALLAEAP